MKGKPKATPVTDLANAIKLQQETVLIETALLNEQLNLAVGSVLSGDFLKDKIIGALAPTKILSGLAAAVSGVVAGALINKAVVGSKAGILRKVMGFVFQIAATKGISKVVSTMIKNKESKM